MSEQPVICTIDLETTGLDFEKDQITEMAYVIKRWGDKKPLLISHQYLRSSVPVSEFITNLTGITDSLLEECGVSPDVALNDLQDMLSSFKVDHILAQNGAGFDKPMLEAKFKEHTCSAVPELNWIDSQHDIEWPESFKSKALSHLACSLGFLNPFPHDALSDVMTTIKVVDLAEQQGITSMDEMIMNSMIPWVYVESNATFNQKEAAKKLRYRWERVDDVHVPKRWINKFKETKLEQAEADAAEAGFKIRRIDGDHDERRIQ